ncbi:hypothetical protein ISS08_00855 [Candidatus Pacearchaeota archaeon]|nr:hypothetical protein [Candidatus Pacearchaeota archaeon]
MKELIKPNLKSIRIFFFLIGIIATLAYRIIIVLNFYDPYWVKVAWYIGTIGFILYFGHRFEIQRRRAKFVKDYNLIREIEKNKQVKGEKKKALLYIIKTTYNSKARWNSLFIFILSLIALIVGIIFDLGIFG